MEKCYFYCNFTKGSSPPWMFFTFFKLYKWYKIGQRIIYIQSIQAFEINLYVTVSSMQVKI